MKKKSSKSNFFLRNRFSEVWRIALADYSSRQLEKYQKMIELIQIETENENKFISEKSKKNHHFLDEDEASMPRNYVPQPSESYRKDLEVNNLDIEKKQKMKISMTATRQKTSRTRSKGRSISKGSIHRSQYYKNNFESSRTKSRKKSQPRAYTNREKEVNKRLYEIEKLLKEKISLISNLVQESEIVKEEVDRLREIKSELQERYGMKETLVQKNKELKRYIVRLEEELNNQDNYDEKILEVRKKKSEIFEKIKELKSKVEEIERKEEIKQPKKPDKFTGGKVNIFNMKERESTFSAGETMTSFYLSIKNKKILAQVFSEWKIFTNISMKQKRKRSIVKGQEEEEIRYLKQEERKRKEEFDKKTEEIRMVLKEEVGDFEIEDCEGEDRIGKRRLKRRLRYFVKVLHNVKLNLIEKSFFRIQNPDFDYFKDRIENGIKMRAFYCLLQESSVKIQARNEARLMQERKKTKIKSKFFFMLKLGISKKNEIENFKKEIEMKDLRITFKNWRIQLKERVKERKKLNFFKRRRDFLVKETVFEGLKQNTKIWRVKKRSLIRVIRLRKKKKLKMRFKQFFGGCKFKKFTDRVRNKQEKRTIHACFKELKFHRNSSLKHKNMILILEKISKEKTRKNSLFGFQSIKLLSDIKKNHILRIKGFQKRKEYKKKEKLFSILFRNYLNQVKKRVKNKESQFEKIAEISDSRAREGENLEFRIEEQVEKISNLKEEIASKENSNKYLEDTIVNQVKEYNGLLDDLNSLANNLQEIEIEKEREILELKSQLIVLKTKKSDLINKKADELREKNRLQTQISKMKLRRVENESDLIIAEKSFENSMDEEQRKIEDLNKEFYRKQTLKKLENDKLAAMQQQLKDLANQIGEASKEKNIIIKNCKRKKNFFKKEEPENFLANSTEDIKTVHLAPTTENSENKLELSQKSVTFSSRNFPKMNYNNKDLLHIKNEILEIKSFRTNMKNDLESRIAALQADMNNQ